jgi:hypothetical protein
LKEILFEITHFGGSKARKFSGLAGAGAARGADARQMVTFHYFSQYRPKVTHFFGASLFGTMFEQ